MFAKLFRRDTDVRESFFRMQLPGQWSRTFDSETERWIFNTEREQFIVSVMTTTRKLTLEEQREILKEIVLTRRRTELEIATGVQLGETVYASLGQNELARYEGSGPTPGRLLTCLVIQTPTTLGSFYYEAVGLSAEEFHARARVALNSVELAQVAGV